MAAAQYDLALEQGATFRLTITWTDSGGTPINLTGATAHMSIRSQVANTDTGAPWADLTTANGGITLGGAAGTIAILVTDAQTATMTQARGRYDLYVTLSNGDRDRLMEGAVTVDPQVTVA